MLNTENYSPRPSPTSDPDSDGVTVDLSCCCKATLLGQVHFACGWTWTIWWLRERLWYQYYLTAYLGPFYTGQDWSVWPRNIKRMDQHFWAIINHWGYYSSSLIHLISPRVLLLGQTGKRQGRRNRSLWPNASRLTRRAYKCRGGRDGSAVESTHWSCRGPRFNFQNSCSSVQPTVSQVPGDLLPSSCIGRHQVWCTAKHLYK